MQRQLIRGLLAVCATAALGLGQDASAASLFVVDGVTLAKSLWLPRAYQCSPSERFEQYSWCRLSRHERGSRGAFTAITSVLRDEGRTVAYVSREIAPAFFAPDEMESEIARLSSRLGEPAREIRLAGREDAPKAMIVVWGKLQLEEVTANTALNDEPGGPEQNLLVDYLGDVRQSRQRGLPVFRLVGGAGYLWSASDRNGRGHLRFLAADPAVLARARGSQPTPAMAQEIAEPAAKGRARVAAAGNGAPPPAAANETTGSVKAKDLRPFLSFQQTPQLSGGAANQELSYAKDGSRVSMAQKARPDAERARILDAERAAAQEREKARLAWTRFEAERAAEARVRLTWTVVAAFLILSAILALLHMLKRREEQIILTDEASICADEDAPAGSGLVARTLGRIALALTKLRAVYGSSPRLAAS